LHVNYLKVGLNFENLNNICFSPLLQRVIYKNCSKKNKENSQNNKLCQKKLFSIKSAFRSILKGFKSLSNTYFTGAYFCIF